MPASKEQKKLMEEFTNYTGLGFMYEGEVDKNDPRGFIAIWETNIESLGDIATNAKRMINAYRMEYNTSQPPIRPTARHG